MTATPGGVRTPRPASLHPELVASTRSVPTAAHTLQVVRIARPGGFDYRDAGIGAGIAVLAVALVGGAIVFLRGSAPHATAH